MSCSVELHEKSFITSGPDRSGQRFHVRFFIFILQIDDLNAQLAKQAKSAMVIT